MSRFWQLDDGTFGTYSSLKLIAMKNSVIRFLFVFGGAVALVSCQKNVDLLDAELIQLSTLDLPDEEAIDWESISEEAAVPIIRTLYQELTPKGYIKQDVIDRNGGLNDQLLTACLSIVSNYSQELFENNYIDYKKQLLDEGEDSIKLEERGRYVWKWDGENKKQKRRWYLAKYWVYKSYGYSNHARRCSGAYLRYSYKECKDIDCNVPAECR